jgi:hypothetical protein
MYIFFGQQTPGKIRRFYHSLVLKIKRFVGRRETTKQAVWAREVPFPVQVRFGVPKIASCSRADAPQCAPLRGCTSRNFDYFWPPVHGCS